MLRRFATCAFALALLHWHPVIAQSWQTLAPMPSSLSMGAAGVVDNTIYVLGGSNGDSPAINSVFAYVPGSDAWTTKASMPVGRSGAAAAGANGVLYAFGGTGAEDGVQAYDPRTDTWSAKARMPRARVMGGAAVVNGKVYVIGGHNSTDGLLSIVDAYDPSTDTWTQKASMPTPRTMLAVTAIDGIVYAVGGLGGAGNELEAYDPASDTWTQKAAMPTARRELTAAVLNGELYAIGGTPGDGTYSNVVEAFNPATGTWANKPLMPTARQDMGSAAANGAIYVFGGNSPFGLLATNEALGSFGIQVSIDIKPGSSPNKINLKSAGVVDVAILSSATFDATQVDPATVTLTASTVRLRGRSDKYSCNVRDVNHDGKPDLVCRVKAADEPMLKAGSTSAVLTGRTFSGQGIQGVDTIQIVP
jgi:N-acetylneuraminic acid mutarotase